MRGVLATGVVFAIALSYPHEANTWQPAVAAQARIVAASIEEHEPFDPKKILERRVSVRLVLAARPQCGSTDPTPIYAFLIDSFPWHRQHVRVPGFPELQFQSKLTFTCAPATGRFTSNIRGEVALESVTDPPGAHALTLRTRVADLPAIEFRWIAIAADGSAYSRAPGSGRFGVWRIRERATR